MRAHLRPSVTDDVLLWKVLCRRFCRKTRKLYRGAPPRAALRQTHTAPKLAARFIWRREPATRPPTSPPRYAKHPPGTMSDRRQTPAADYNTPHPTRPQNGWKVVFWGLSEISCDHDLHMICNCKSRNSNRSSSRERSETPVNYFRRPLLMRLGGPKSAIEVRLQRRKG